MEQLPPKVITLGHEESEIFNAIIHGAYGDTLQTIADQDQERALDALTDGVEAILLSWGKVAVTHAVVSDKAQAEATVSSVSQEDDGFYSFEGIIKEQLKKDSADYHAALEDGKEIIIRAMTDPRQTDLPILDEDTFVVAVIK